VSEERRTTPDEARRVGDQIDVDWDRFDLSLDGEVGGLLRESDESGRRRRSIGQSKQPREEP
jgi:hypothetical protein